MGTPRHRGTALRGQGVLLRPLLPRDRLIVAGWMADGETAGLMGTELGPWDNPASTEERMAMAIETGEGRFIGYLALRDISWRLRQAELRICIGEKDFWGRGLGADALITYLGYIFRRTRLRVVYLRVLADNHRAIRCYRKCGFRIRGVLRAGSRRWRGFRDVLLMDYNAPVSKL